MRRFLLATTLSLCALTSPARAQGVPTYDGTQLAQLVAQLEHMAEDLNVQLQQLATMKLELETQLSQLLNLEAQLRSLIEGSGLGQLFATIEEFRALRGKLIGPLNTARSLANGDFLSGFNPGAQMQASVRRVLSSSTSSTLKPITEPAVPLCEKPFLVILISQSFPLIQWPQPSISQFCVRFAGPAWWRKRTPVICVRMRGLPKPSCGDAPCDWIPIRI